MKKINSVSGRPRAVVISVSVSRGLSLKMCNYWCMDFTVRVTKCWNKLPRKVRSSILGDAQNVTEQGSEQLAIIYPALSQGLGLGGHQKCLLCSAVL